MTVRGFEFFAVGKTLTVVTGTVRGSEYSANANDGYAVSEVAWGLLTVRARERRSAFEGSSSGALAMILAAMRRFAVPGLALMEKDGNGDAVEGAQESDDEPLSAMALDD